MSNRKYSTGSAPVAISALRALICLAIAAYALLCLPLPLFAQVDKYSDIANLTHAQDEESNIVVYATNALPIPVYFYITGTAIRNYQPSSALPYGVVVPAQASEYRVLSFDIVDKKRRGSVRYAYKFSFGNPYEARHDNDHRYIFPFAHGAKFEVGQSHNGSYTHNNDQNRYAIDFNMDIGTPVHAARDGVVVFVKEDSNIGGASARYGEHGNVIIIMHNDGSFANYVHLRRNGAIVKMGDQVQTGQHIGYSGNTGRSTGPHLHFDVQIPDLAGSMVSIPVTFASLLETIYKPEEREYYYSSHPGKDPFEVRLGRVLTPESFDGYIKAVEDNRTLDVRSEQIDNTFVIFCINGTVADLNLELNVATEGLDAELEYPFRVAIPAQSEVFCGIFRRQQGASRIRLTPNLIPVE